MSGTYNPKVYKDQGGDRMVVAAGGAIVIESGGAVGLVGTGTAYFVDANAGSNSNDGLSWATPFLTMAKAFASVVSGDTIVFRGKIKEQLVTPVQVFDVTVIGAGNRPRHADSTPDGGQDAANTWAAPDAPAATTALCRVLQQGWRFKNILFAPPADYAALEFVRNAGAGNAERDASHAHVIGCRFAGGQDGIQFGKAATYTEIVNNPLIEDCIFNDQTGSAIKTDTGMHVARAKIVGNNFRANANHIIAAMDNCEIAGKNIFGPFTTKSIDLDGGTGLNVIYDNYLSGTYSEVGGYRKANANDDWGGNWNTGVGILTAADPA